MEKQKTGRVEAMMREQRAAMEKELGGMQAKAQGSYQDNQTMQIKVRALVSCLRFEIDSVVFKNVNHVLHKTAWRLNLIVCIVPTGEGAAGKPDHSPAAGERHPEGRGQLGHQPDGEQVSATLQ